jgi:hypothetical protein
MLSPYGVVIDPGSGRGEVRCVSFETLAEAREYLNDLEQVDRALGHSPFRLTTVDGYVTDDRRVTIQVAGDRSSRPVSPGETKEIR